jgi:hypothetical protein
MQTISLKIEDAFFPHFKALIDSLVKDKKVELVDEYDYENNYPQEAVVSSIEEVRRRVYEAEKEPSMTEAEYDATMNNFFNNEPGIDRR